jgi:hypothetical protein
MIFDRFAAQRPCRAGAPGGVVAARRQPGPRYRTGQAAAGALTAPCGNDDRHTDHRAGNVRGAFTAVQKLLLDPMPYKDPGDLYYVWREYGPINDVKRGALAGTDIAELQKPNTVIEAAAALRSMLGGIFSLREGVEPWKSPPPNMFDMLGIAPALGRDFAPDEAGLGPGREHTIILTHNLWNRLGAALNACPWRIAEFSIYKPFAHRYEIALTG